MPYTVARWVVIIVMPEGDMFDPKVKWDWTLKVFKKMARNRQHQYFMLTKRPQNINHFEGFIELYRDHIKDWCMGVSITNNADLWRIDELIVSWPYQRFISFEPLLDDVGEKDLHLVDMRGMWNIDWIIIGGQSGPKPFYPPKAWVENIKGQAKAAGIPVYLKGNLRG